MPLTSTLTEDFSGATLDTVSKWSASFGAPSIVTGRGRVPCSTAFAGIKTPAIYTVQGSQLFARVYPAAANGATTSTVKTEMTVSQTAGSQFVTMYLDSFTNKLHMRIAFADQVTGGLTYDPVAHAWWRMRETGGTFFFETSADGFTWVQRASTATPTYVSSTGDSAVILGSNRANGTANYAEFDNVDIAPTAAFSKVGTLQDNFNQPLDTTKWAITGTATAGTGAALVGSNSDFHSVADLDLTGSVAMVNVATPATGTGVHTNLVVDNPNTAGTNLRIDRENSGANLYFESQVGFADGARTSVVYDPVAHAWWKIEEAGGSVNFSTSPDSQTWTIQRSIATPTWVTDVKPHLSVDGTATANAVFDNFNSPVVPITIYPKTATLTDDFTGTVLDPSKWSAPAGGVSLNDAAYLTPALDGAGGSIRLQSVLQYDLSNSHFYVGSVTPSTVPTAETEIIVANASGASFEELRIICQDGLITSGIYISGVANTVDPTPVPYPAGTFGLQIRHDGTSVFFEVTLNGTFTDFPAMFTVPASDWMAGPVALELEAPLPGTANSVVTLSALSPNGSALGGGATITATGSGFIAGSTVTVDTTTGIATTIASDSNLTFAAPAHAAGTVNVEVVNSNGASNPQSFTYSGTPITSSFTPNTTATPGGHTHMADFRTASSLFVPLDKWSLGTAIGGTTDDLPLSDQTNIDTMKALGPLTYRLAICNWDTGAPKSRQGTNTAQQMTAFVGKVGGNVYPLLLGPSSNSGANDDNQINAAGATALAHFFNDAGGQNGGPITRVGIGNEPSCGNGAWARTAAAYATLFETAYQAIHAVAPGIACTGSNVGCINGYNDSFVTAAGGNASHIGGLSFHAYSGAAHGIGTMEYAVEIDRLRAAYPGRTYGVEEFNWAPSSAGGTSPFFSWQNHCFLTNVMGQCLYAGGHAYQFLDSGLMGVLSQGSNNNQPAKYTKLPSYWAFAAFTGQNGKLRDVRGSYVQPSNTPNPSSAYALTGGLAIYAFSNGKMIVVNTNTSGSVTVDLAMGGTATGQYDLYQSIKQTTNGTNTGQAQGVQNTGYLPADGGTQLVSKGTYSGSVLPSFSAPFGTVSIIELFQ